MVDASPPVRAGTGVPSLVRVLRLLGVVVPVAILAAAVLLLVNGRERQLADNERRLDILNAVVSEQFARSTEAIEVVLRQAAASVATAPAVDDRTVARLREDFGDFIASLPLAHGLTWVNAQGYVTVTTIDVPLPIYVGDSEMFRNLMRAPAERAVIGPPARSNRGGEWVVPFARTVVADGKPAGIVILSVPSVALSRSFVTALRDTSEGMGRVFHHQVLLAIQPHDELAIGRVFPSTPTIDAALADTAGGHAAARVIAQDRAERLIDVRRVGDTSLVSVLTQPTGAVSRAGRTTALAFIAGTLLLAGAVGAGFWLLARSLALHTAAVAQAAMQDRRRIIAESANREKSRFLAAASHDLRQPLHALGLFANALSRRVRGEEQLMLVNSIQEAVTSMSSMFGALLDLARIDAKGLDPKPVLFALDPVLERAVREAEPEATAKGLTIRRVPTTVTLHTDPVLLANMIRNLLTNAVRYTDKGRILVGCRGRGAMVDIEIVDTGVGIAETDRERIFGEFERGVAKDGQTKQGLGLGLAIVRRIADALDVAVGIRSTYRRGSAFFIRVPRAKALPEPEAPETDDDEPLPAGNILVLDDDPAIRRALTQDLTDRGFTVEAPDDLKALDPYAFGKPAGIVIDLDLGLPADGLDLLAEAERRIGRRLPALLVTGSTNQEILNRLRASGRTWLHKPTSGDAIVAALRKIWKKAPGA